MGLRHVGAPRGVGLARNCACACKPAALVATRAAAGDLADCSSLSGRHPSRARESSRVQTVEALTACYHEQVADEATVAGAGSYLDEDEELPRQRKQVFGKKGRGGGKRHSKYQNVHD